MPMLKVWDAMGIQMGTVIGTIFLAQQAGAVMIAQTEGLSGVQSMENICVLIQVGG